MRSGIFRRCRRRNGLSACRTSAPRTAFQRRMREGVAAEDAEPRLRPHHARRPTRRCGGVRASEEGQTYIDLPEHLRRYRSDIFTDKYKRLAWSEVSRSITAHIAKDGYWYIHPQQHRTLSIREAARVQTFPDWFRFAGQPTLRLRQIGNAVPPMLGEAVGRQLVAALVERSPSREAARRSISARGCSSGTGRTVASTRGAAALDPWIVLAGETVPRADAA